MTVPDIAALGGATSQSEPSKAGVSRLMTTKRHACAAVALAELPEALRGDPVPGALSEALLRYVAGEAIADR